jgi:kinesin family member C2/C3
VFTCVYLRYSSRSHLIFRLTVEGKDSISETMTKGSLTLCDLAGSERVSRSEVKGEQLKEAAAINTSLSALGQVGLLKL